MSLLSESRIFVWAQWRNKISRANWSRSSPTGRSWTCSSRTSNNEANCYSEVPKRPRSSPNWRTVWWSSVHLWLTGIFQWLTRQTSAILLCPIYFVPSFLFQIQYALQKGHSTVAKQAHKHVGNFGTMDFGAKPLGLFRGSFHRGRYR